MNIAQQIIDIASQRDKIITTAESCTGGLVSASLTDISGSSVVFQRGYVTYSNDAKEKLLGVSPKTLQIYGAVSEQVAAEMANGALERSKAGIAISITGIAGPGGSEFKPEGRVCFGLAMPKKTVATKTIEFGALGRANVRKAASNHALELVLAELLKINQNNTH